MRSIRELEKKLQAPSQLDGLDFLLLLSFASKKPKEWLIANPHYRLSPVAYLLFRYYLWLRKRGIPFAYIAGHKEFFGIDFVVNKHTLIPRPDTEVLVESVIEEIRNKKQDIVLIDVGTGTGCIPISIIKTLKHKNIKTIAVDISNKALCVAKYNARIQKVFIDFLHGNLLEPVLKDQILNKNEHAIITANLPYLTNEQFLNEPSVQKEPKKALVAEKNGLALYEDLFRQIQSLLPTTNYHILAFIEFDPRQTEQLLKLITKILPRASTYVIKDLAGHDRVAKIIL